MSSFSWWNKFDTLRLSLGEWFFASVISKSGRVQREEWDGMRDEERWKRVLWLCGLDTCCPRFFSSELMEICMSKVLACSALLISSSQPFPEPPPAADVPKWSNPILTNALVKPQIKSVTAALKFGLKSYILIYLYTIF